MTVSPPVAIGILGAARVATYALIAPARAEPRARLAGIAARDSDRARTYAHEHGIERSYDSYDALLSDPSIELVYVATPPAFHAKLALASLAAGKHVLVEKPFSMNAAEATEVARAAVAAERFVFEAMHSRHSALFRRITEIVQSEVLGDIARADAEFKVAIPRSDVEFRWSRDLGGGALMDLGVYPLAWLRGLFGEPRIVSAEAKFESGVDAEIAGELLFAQSAAARSGLRATFRASMIAVDFSALLVVEGSKGNLRVVNPLAPQLGHSLSLTVAGKTEKETVEGPSSFACQLSAICATLRGGSSFLLPAQDYVASMQAIDAVRAAAERESSRR
ncbi:MAG: Gfo/Idh/MocA family oxidoreductase [Alphaproteobacteria bacterium]|nr:Gfo/Idh/MocA family oxidoreductase [Alphaproteobacteria bacterium]